MLTGLSRLDKRVDTRMPITLDILQNILKFLPVICVSKYESIMFAAIFSLGFFGFFRIGELVASSLSDQGHSLQSYNIRFVDCIKSLEIVLPHSKNDQSGYGHIIRIPETRMCTCPVRAVLSYLSIRPCYVGPFFCHLSGNPVTRYQFVCILKMTLTAAGIDSKLYGSHSFRIGAATTAAMAGIDNDKIAEFGRWKSGCYKSYIRIPSVNMVSFSK